MPPPSDASAASAPAHKSCFGLILTSERPVYSRPQADRKVVEPDKSALHPRTGPTTTSGRRVLRHPRSMTQDRDARGDVRYEERWCSGGIVGSLGARSCLRVTVTDRELVVCGHFPFSLVTDLAGLDVLVPRGRVRVLRDAGDMDEPLPDFAPGRVLVELHGGGPPRRLWLRLREPERFTDALEADRGPPSEGEYR